ncbi:Leucine rich repeat containing protein 51 [Fasciola hepatica]|uniref:Leucine-rich repeat-containing protein 51 n=1 Tax=Fasciola hepatica TaxID=6192 RepID=A0A4E0RYC9_FASHE|nr:Leucine rich repeat containing protein 51 [Fasciola hepatica]
MSTSSPKITKPNACMKIYQPLDFSFLDLKEVTDVEGCEPRMTPGLVLKCPKTNDGKWLTQTLKMNNNQIEIINELPIVVSELFGSCDYLTWLDLSCNKISVIANGFQEVQKLQTLQNLNKLTLHGNPIEREKGYFHIVLGILPDLLSLDFTGISNADHQIAANCKRRSAKHRKTKQ